MSNKNNYSKLIASSLFTTAAIVAIAPVTSAAEYTGYTDVKPSDDHYEGIKALTEQGVVKGYEDGSFGVYDNVTRQQVAVMLSIALKLETPANVDGVLQVYEDVDGDSLYAEEIAAVTEAGIFKGSDGSFNPAVELTREQMATVLVLGLDLKENRTHENVKINLDNVGASHKENVQILSNLGITNQNDDFRPHEGTTRGSFSTFLYLAQKLDIDENFELSLMHTGDTHAHLDNVAKRVTAVKSFRAEHPDALLIDSGDVFQGTLYFNEFLGQASREFMNLMDYDAMTFGNHEFDLGSSENGHKGLAEFVGAAEFPFVSSNVDFSKDKIMSGLFHKDTVTASPEDGEIYSGIIEEIDGEKVGIFALTTEETTSLSSPNDVTFENYLETAENAVEGFESQGIDKIIAVTHIGYNDNPEIDNDLQLAAQVDGIDVILGGHSHTELDKSIVTNTDENGAEKAPTIIDHTYQYGEFLGTLNVEFDENGTVVGHAGKLVEISEQVPDEKAVQILDKYSSKIEELKYKESGGVAVQALPNPRLGDGDSVSVRNSETALGNLIADGMLNEARKFNESTVLAMQNGGGIRTSIDEGPIMLGEILTVLPFGNTLATIELSGTEIKTALEHSISQAPAESGGFLHVSGMKFTYDSSKPAGDRVQSIKLNQGGEYVDLDSNEMYIIATNAFTAKGGDGYEVFAKAYAEGRVTDLGSADWENLRNYVAELGTVDPQIEGRIVDVALSK